MFEYSRLLCATFLAEALMSTVSGHGGLTFPPPRNNYNNINPANWSHQPHGDDYHSGGPCAGAECLWFSEGCFHGCPNCSLTMPAVGNYYGTPSCANPNPYPTLPEKYRTWNINNVSLKGDWTKFHPWRSPGHNPVADSCGIAGGYLKAQGGGGETPTGAHQGDLGSKLPPLQGVNTTWFAGSVAEVGWMVGANHGGGYHYSLCPTGTPLTEDCFNKLPLSYVGSNHTIRYLDGRAELQIPATDVSEGTFPEGSTWRLNPIPACNCDKGFMCSPTDKKSEGGARYSYANTGSPVPAGFACPTGTQFPVPFDYGYGQQVWNLTPDKAGAAADTWVIVDKVQVPATITGEYVLRWRWDVEQNPQIWTHCADITIVAK
eukprot:m.260040 g.260040  ORF g.260040 m.260040 type:complete len:375 (-) comp19673_c0_seq1:330-1454(-)